ncbi:MAG: copper resistance protein CopC [Actinobacteria bacterium]|nr:copper resistance protein CopC [Actinomycetota bacterium]
MKISKFLLTAGALTFSFVALPASAHTVLVSANPAINSTVVALPSAVSLTFADELVALGDSNSISVTDENGTELISGKPEISGAVLSIKLDVSEVTGVIKVIYRAVAADGHVITGDYQFTVSPVVTSETATRILEEIAPTRESGNKVSIYLIISATLVVGGGLLLFFIWKRQSK